MDENNENILSEEENEEIERIAGRESYEWARSLVAAVLIISSLLILVRELTVLSSERTTFDETGESD